jgi:hypothetical protein
MEEGFAKLGMYSLRGTVAAGDGIIFKMQVPKGEEVDGDVTSYFTRKGYYAYGLQAFCDSNCKFVMIASRICSSSGDNTAYISTQLSKDIKANLLPKEYHVVLDEAYPCMGQEMSPWKGRDLEDAEDAFNYYLSLHRQCIERAFGILVQRWGIFWRPLRVSMEHRGVLIRVACKLHNICIDRYSTSMQRIVRRLDRGAYGFTDIDVHGDDDNRRAIFTDGTRPGRGFRRDKYNKVDYRQIITDIMREKEIERPSFANFRKSSRQ